MTALDAYRTAELLATDGHTDSDAVTHADMDQEAGLAGADRPAIPHDRHTIRATLDTIGNTR